MKRYIAVIAAILIIALFALPVAAEESGEGEVVVTEEGTEAVVETSSDQTTADVAEELESAPQIHLADGVDENRFYEISREEYEKKLAEEMEVNDDD